MPRAAPLQIEDAELPALERRILAEHLDDRFGIGSLLELGEHQHLVLVRAVNARLARRDPYARHDHGLDAREELVVTIDTRRRRDHDPPGLRSTAITDQVADAAAGRANSAAATRTKTLRMAGC